MILSHKALEKLREIINGDNTDRYRSGPKLVEFFNRLGFRDTYGPVSYTHLDVYKRQVFEARRLKSVLKDKKVKLGKIDEDGGRGASQINNTNTVSYTHLDVYKRQGV